MIASLEEKKKAILATIPSREDISKLFLRNTERAWQLSQQHAAALKAEAEQAATQPYNELPIIRCEATPVSGGIQVYRDRKWLDGFQR